MNSNEIRDTVIQQAQQERIVRDTLILQKVNRAHREAFKTRFPGQVEHCLRLTMERLQAGLDKRGEFVLDDPESWKMSTIELQELAHTAYLLNEIRRGF